MRIDSIYYGPVCFKFKKKIDFPLYFLKWIFLQFTQKIEKVISNLFDIY